MPGKDSVQWSEARELEVLIDEILKQLIPWIGRAGDPDAKTTYYHAPKELERILQLSLPEEGQGRNGLLEAVSKTLQYSVNTWNSGFFDKLYASTNAVGVISELLLVAIAHGLDVSPVLTLMERKTAREIARLFGFKGQHAGGVNCPGGSSSNLHSIITARNLKFPKTKTAGVGHQQFVMFTSKHGHYSMEKAAIVTGIGSDAVISIAINAEGQMIVSDLEEQVKRALDDGKIPFYVNATAGTTVMGSFDPLDEIAAVCKRYDLWMHIDASWGGSVAFSEPRKHLLSGSEQANSITINPHKMLGVPLQCSYLLAADARLLQEANSLRAEYLFHGDSEENEYDLADATIGCGRRPDALKMYLSWVYYGRKGLEKRVESAYSMVSYFADKLDKSPEFALQSTNPPPCLQVCFYYTPSGQLKEKSYNTQVTRMIAQELTAQGKFLVDYAPGPHGDFFRAVINAPSVTRGAIDQLVDSISLIGDRRFKKCLD